jgi:hypothetical protein
MSALYLAASVRDNGGGTAIGSELLPQKVNTARCNLAEARPRDLVDLREGDARPTFRDLGGPNGDALGKLRDSRACSGLSRDPCRAPNTERFTAPVRTYCSGGRIS